nr:hypothetical protein [uncultured Pseudodesulfovibrio sp.]
MSFFSHLVQPYRKGEKNFERGRAAELRRDFKKAEDYFTIAAQAFDEHFTKKAAAGKDTRTSHLVMAGICYTRIGRFEDGLRILEQCIETKDIPDAFLHAGYAAAKLGLAEKAVSHWKSFPDWAGQRVIANALKEQVKAIRSSEKPDLQGACEAVAKAVQEQDKVNQNDRKFRDRGQRDREHRQGY